MIRISLILIIIFSIIAESKGQIQEVETQKILENLSDWKTLDENAYSIQYPASWAVNKNAGMGTSFILFSELSNEMDKFKENVNLLIQDLSGYDLNLDQYAEISTNQIKTIIAEGNIILNERKSSTQGEYQKVIYTGTVGDFKLKFEQYYMVVGDKAYIVTLTCEVNEFDKYQKTGEEILNSFKLK